MDLIRRFSLMRNKINRRDLMKRCAASGLSFGAGVFLTSCRSSQIFNDSNASGKKPNIIFIFSDDWGWGDLSCHGNDWLSTPNLDHLASQGTEFYQFNVNNPVCSPSRTAVITGQFPARHCSNNGGLSGRCIARTTMVISV